MLSTAHRLIRRRLSAADSDSGFTLVECIVSVLIFGTVIGAAGNGTVQAISAANTTRNEVAAANLAQQDLQLVRSVSSRSTLTAVAAHSVTVGSDTYTVKRTLSASCPASVSTAGTTKITVTTTVTWPGHPAGVAMAMVVAC